MYGVHSANYKRCSGITGRLTERVTFIYNRCAYTLNTRNVQKNRLPQMSLRMLRQCLLLRSVNSAGGSSESIAARISTI